MKRIMMKHSAVISALLLLLTAAPSRAQSSWLQRTNRSGGDSRPGQVQRVTLGASTIENFGLVDFPGSSDSGVSFINSKGEMAGGYGPNLEVGIPNSGFALTKDSFKPINFPGATYTSASAVMNSGGVVGTYVDSAGNEHGFQFAKGIYTSIDVPGAILTAVNGASPWGEIVGVYDDATGGDHGFTLLEGTYATLDAPGAISTFANSANKSGEVVGGYYDAANNAHGFLWVSGVFTTVDYPGAPQSVLLGINDAGVMVGAYGDGNPFYGGFENGFIVGRGDYLTVDVPFVGAGATWAEGINNSDQIVGIYIDTAGRVYGYTATLVP